MQHSICNVAPSSGHFPAPAPSHFPSPFTGTSAFSGRAAIWEPSAVAAVIADVARRRRSSVAKLHVK